MIKHKLQMAQFSTSTRCERICERQQATKQGSRSKQTEKKKTLDKVVRWFHENDIVTTSDFFAKWNIHDFVNHSLAWFWLFIFWLSIFRFARNLRRMHVTVFGLSNKHSTNQRPWMRCGLAGMTLDGEMTNGNTTKPTTMHFSNGRQQRRICYSGVSRFKVRRIHHSPVSGLPGYDVTALSPGCRMSISRGWCQISAQRIDSHNSIRYIARYDMKATLYGATCRWKKQQVQNKVGITTNENRSLMFTSQRPGGVRSTT